MNPLHECARADRQSVLHQAASLLQSVWPKAQVWSTAADVPHVPPAIFSREPSGAVRVVHRYTGALIAQSLPAPLTVLDPKLFGPIPAAHEEAAFLAMAECITAGSTLAALAKQLDRTPFRALSVPELAYVLRIWAERLHDEG